MRQELVIAALALCLRSIHPVVVHQPHTCRSSSSSPRVVLPAGSSSSSSHPYSSPPPSFLPATYRGGATSSSSSIMGRILRSWRECESPVGGGGLLGRFQRFINSLLFGSTPVTKLKAKKKLDKHLTKSYRRGQANYRIQKELRDWLANPIENLNVAVGDNLRVWVVTLTGAKGTIYAGEKYKLKFTFPMDYPSKPPSVYFLQPTPRHEHVYTNGDICLNLLGRDWRPNMTASTLALSILSMLSSAKEKKIPQDNQAHADAPPGRVQENWLYHDDKC